MVSRLAGELAALRAEVAALRRRQPSGTGVSTAFGATSVRTMQLGFAAELTSAYDATTGYSWKALELNRATPGFENPAAQLTGQYAFTADDNQTLASGTRVWLEPDPCATGHVIVSATDAGGGGAAWFWAEITGGTDAAGYSWKRKYLSAAATWSDATTPAPLTGTSNAYRAPSALSTSIPAVPSGQVLLIRPSPTLDGSYEIGPWGGRQAVTVVTAVSCVDGEIVVTTATLTGRDLSLV